MYNNSMSKDKIHPIIIIGAGPAGLSLAYNLRQLGLDPLILEAGDSPGHSWREMPDFLSLVSYWRSNFLLEKDRFYFPPLSQVKAKDFSSYLRQFTKENNIHIQLNHPVTSVIKEDGVFEVKSQERTYWTSILVNCTGYYSSPFTPNYPGIDETKILKLHFRDYKNIDSLNKSKKVLVVGTKLSAGQTLLELKDKSLELSLSTRSKPFYLPPNILLKVGLGFFDHFEKAAQSVLKDKISTSTPMPYEAKRLINSNQVKVLPEIKSFHENSISFIDGATEPFEAVIFATGFQPKFAHLNSIVELNKDGLPKLSDAFESLYCNNLFFLGLDHQNSIQSRFLRGIRKDSKELADLIERRSKD